MTSGTVIAAGVVLAAGCGSPKSPHSDPQGIASIGSSHAAGSLAVTTTSGGAYGVDFGPVAVGQERVGAALLQNTGVAPLQLISIGAPTDPEFGELPVTAGEVVQAGTEISLAMSFTPSDAGVRTATIVFETDSVKTPTVTLALIGTGTTP
jgi:hypothetical protein